MAPIAFHLGSFEVRWYGVMVALGFLVGLWTAGRRGVRDGFVPDQIHDLGIVLIIGAIAGARTLYVTSYWHEDFEHAPLTEVFMIHHGGLVYYGGLIGASLACIVYAMFKHLPIWKLADALAPSIALGYAFGRIGCLLNGCCYGRACDLPWAIHFPPKHPTHAERVHPTQVYDSLLNLVFYVALAWLYRRKKFDGQVFATYLVGYSLLRAFVETFRGDYPQRYIGGHFTPAQLVSAAILATGLILFSLLSRVRRANPG